MFWDIAAQTRIHFPYLEHYRSMFACALSRDFQHFLCMGEEKGNTKSQFVLWDTCNTPEAVFDTAALIATFKRRARSVHHTTINLVSYFTHIYLKQIDSPSNLIEFT